MHLQGFSTAKYWEFYPWLRTMSGTCQKQWDDTETLSNYTELSLQRNWPTIASPVTLVFLREIMGELIKRVSFWLKNTGGSLTRMLLPRRRARPTSCRTDFWTARFWRWTICGGMTRKGCRLRPCTCYVSSCWPCCSCHCSFVLVDSLVRLWK